MAFNNLKSENGFVRYEDIYERMSWRTPPDGGDYEINRISSSFSNVCVKIYDKNEELFRIWTGCEEVYNYVQNQVIKATIRIRSEKVYRYKEMLTPEDVIPLLNLISGDIYVVLIVAPDNHDDLIEKLKSAGYFSYLRQTNYGHELVISDKEITIKEE